MATNCKEILGLYKIALYENKGLKIFRPDIAKPKEVDIIFSGSENYVIDYVSLPFWNREIDYSDNYKPVFSDTFTFVWFGNAYDTSIYNLRNNRNGFIVEIITPDAQSFVFPTPVFASEVSAIESNTKSYRITMAYRQPTFKDRLVKINTLIMNQNYILSGLNSIAGSGDNKVLIWK